jgi:hypothetical protein
LLGKQYGFSAFRHGKHTVLEGRLKNRPALQRRLLTIQIGPAPEGRGEPSGLKMIRYEQQRIVESDANSSAKLRYAFRLQNCQSSCKLTPEEKEEPNAKI